MGLVGRIWQVIRTNAITLLKEAEDPEKILAEVIEQIEHELISMRQSIAHAIALQKRTERQLKHNQVYAQQWYHRAELAIKKQQEDLARESLFRRKSYLDQVNFFQIQIKEQLGTIDKLKQQMRLLEGKLCEMKMKKDLYLARSRSAAVAQKLQGIDTVKAFESIEQKILELEARANLKIDPIEERFNYLEANAQIEAEITTIKQNTAVSPSQKLEESQSEAIESQKLRKEIEKI